MKINFLTQDPSVFPFVTVELPPGRAQKGPSDSRMAVIDRPEYPAAKPDKNGDFLYQPGQPQFDACEPYGILKFGLNLYSGILGREIPFAFRGKLRIFPHDDQGINAYYNREDQGVHFLYLNDPRLKKELEMAESLDVGAHEENGHLLLDGLRPQYLNLELESHAFHEAFGDISSMILALQFDQVIDRMLRETGGNLRRPNVVSRLGEEAGEALQALAPRPKKNHGFLRDATFTLKYDWKYRSPETMETWIPKDEKKLGAEPHNFSRLFTGVWYEIFTALYETDPLRGKKPVEAVKNARDVATRLVIRGVADFTPDTTCRFEEVAKGMLAADRIEYGGRHRDLLSTVFRRRNLIKPEGSAQDLPKIRLNRPILTRGEARRFLSLNRKALGLDDSVLLEPAEDFPPGCKRFVYHNRNGETFLVFHTTQDFMLHGSLYGELNGAEYKITGSLQLGFDRKGNLISLSSDLLSEEKRERIERNIRQFLANRHIRMTPAGVFDPRSPENFTGTGHHSIPYFAHASWKKGRVVLERIPIFAER